MLEGLKGRPIGELCAEHEISQGQYYQWRDQFLAKTASALGYRAPNVVEAEHFGHATPLAAAC